MHEIENAALGRIKLLGWAPWLSESEVPMNPAPTLGQHSREVVAEGLDLAGDDIDPRIRDGVIHA